MQSQIKKTQEGGKPKLWIFSSISKAIYNITYLTLLVITGFLGFFGYLISREVQLAAIIVFASLTAILALQIIYSYIVRARITIQLKKDAKAIATKGKIYAVYRYPQRYKLLISIGGISSVGWAEKAYFTGQTVDVIYNSERPENCLVKE